MLKIYLSGAIFNKDIKEAKKEFNEVEKSLNKTLKIFDFGDFEKPKIYNPFKILKVNKKYSYKDYLREGIKVLCDCNILINIKNNGWEKSKGAILERKIAKVLFIDIFDIKQFEAFIYKYDFKKYLLDYFKKKQGKIKNVYIRRF